MFVPLDSIGQLLLPRLLAMLQAKPLVFLPFCFFLLLQFCLDAINNVDTKANNFIYTQISIDMYKRWEIEVAWNKPI